MTHEVLVSVFVTTIGVNVVEVDWWCSEPLGGVNEAVGAEVGWEEPGWRVKEGRHAGVEDLEKGGTEEGLRMGEEALTGEDTGTTDDTLEELVASALGALVVDAATVAALVVADEAPVAAAAPAVYRVGPGMS